MIDPHIPISVEIVSNNSPETRPQSSTSMSPIFQSSASTNDDSILEIKLSKKRWLVLAAFSVFGLTVSLTDLTGPVLELYLKLLDLDIKQYLYLRPIFFYIMMILAFPTAICVDKYGIKASMRAAACLSVVHGFLQAIVFYPEFPHHKVIKFPCWIASSITGFELLTIYFLLPLKVSETWFPASERNVAWAFMSTQFNVGACFASLIYPRIVRAIGDFKYLAYTDIACVLITAFTSFTLVTQDEPKHPPSERVAKAKNEPPTSFRKSLAMLIKNRDIIIHLLHMAIFQSLSLCVDSITQPILKSIGYNEIFTGNLTSFTLLLTIFMQIFSAFFVHKFKNLIFVCKLSSLAQGILFIVYLLIIIAPQGTWVLISVTVIFNLCKSWVSPNNANVTAYLSCGTVSQATIIGFSMFINLIVMTVTNFTFTKLISISGSEQKPNYNDSLLFLSVFSIINEIFYLGFFHTRPTVKSGGDSAPTNCSVVEHQSS